MRRALFLLALLGLLMACSGSDEGVLCKIQIMQNKVYRTTSQADMTSLFQYDATDSIGAAMAETMGTMEVMQTSHSVAIARTGSIDTTGRVPLFVRLDSSTTIQTMNGDTVPGQLPASLDSAIELTGSYADGEVLIDPSGTVNPQLRSLAQSMVVQLAKSVNFPEEPIKQGETFSHSVPMALPFPGAASLSIITTYTLDHYDDTLAWFSMKQELGRGDDAADTDPAMTMDGSGTVIYDRRIDNISSVEIISTAVVSAAMTGQGFGTTVNTTVKYTVDVSDAPEEPAG